MYLRRYSQGLAALTLAIVAPAAQAQDAAGAPRALSSSEASAFKRKPVAVALAIVPGGGHFYAGERRRGALTLTAFTLGTILLANAGASGNTPCPPPTAAGDEAIGGGAGPCGEQGRSIHIGLAGLAMTAGSWLYSVLDAAPAAGRANRRNGLSARIAQRAPFLSLQPEGSAVVGLPLRAF